MRVAIVGSAGSGKSTLARRVADRIGARHIEIDAFFHLSGWERQDPEVLAEQIAAETGAGSWVCDGNYQSTVGELVQSAADVIVVYDLPRHMVMRQLVGRTVRRAVRREVLWNGNREPLTNFMRRDPDRNVIRWSWVHHRAYQDRFRAIAESGAWNHAELVWVRRHDDADRWLERLPHGPDGVGHGPLNLR